MLDRVPSLPVSPALQFPQDTTPREDSSYKNAIPYTPKGDEADIFRYYCPLCMQYFQLILRTTCCKNYICLSCTRDWLQSKHIESLIPIDNFGDHHALDDIHCPHCTSKGFHPVRVSHREAVRDYSQTPCHNSQLTSPLRIGESFEDMKRKMLPYRIPGETSVAGIAMAEESPDADTSCELEHGSSDITILSPRITRANDAVAQLNATPMLQVTRDCDSKDSDPPTSASAKSCGLDELVSGRRYQRGDDGDDTQRLAGFTFTPHAKSKTSSRSYDEVSVPSLLADGKGSNDDLLSDNLSDVDDELEETAAESTSMIFAQLVCVGCSQHHRLAEQVVGDIFQRALLPREVLSQQ